MDRAKRGRALEKLGQVLSFPVGHPQPPLAGGATPLEHQSPWTGKEECQWCKSRPLDWWQALDRKKKNYTHKATHEVVIDPLKRDDQEVV